ncbi:hypothetical protein Pan97_34810 [Bremerella volcania]|uniref:SF3 helicase domain-containing protein n=1 Tax=Bremerella volcania TaxID=2527984 RepID=A0A518CB21_9BACT|nr:primase-helicase zinc-binding domain-containing protein [Bremerella volcania]QDU76432.1 hypothetical protein Pan97_34810 [Bremerella volcania]
MISKNIPANFSPPIATPSVDGSNGHGRRTFDAAEVKTAAAGRTLDILVHVAGIPSSKLDGQHHSCPACGGTDRFRLVDPEAGAVFCNQCFNSNNGDFLSASQHFGRTGDFPETLQRIGDFLGMQPTREATTTPATVDAVGHLAAIKSCPRESLITYGAKAEIHQQGSSSEFKVTFPVYAPNCQPCSDFSIWPYSTNKKRLKGMLAKGKPAGVFLPHNADGTPRFPQPGETWLIVEGVKDASALHAKGFMVVGINGEKLSPKFVALFRGCNVVIVPDRTTSAEEKANESAARLAGFAQSVRVAVLPLPLDGSKGDDTRDALKQPNGEELVKNAIEGALEWQPNQKKMNQGSGDEEPSHCDIAAQIWAESLVDKANELSRYCRHQKKTWKWNGHTWEHIEDDHFTKVIWQHMHIRGQRPTKSKVASVEQALRLMILAPTTGDSTFWLSPPRDMPSNFDPQSAIPTKSKLIFPTAGMPAAGWPVFDRTAAFFTTGAHDFDFDQQGENLVFPDCPNWKKYLSEIFDDELDQILTLQMFVGYCLTELTNQQKFLLWSGPKRSGKSLGAKMIQLAVGKHLVASTSLLSLAGSHGMASMVGHRLAVLADERRLSRQTAAEVLPRILSITGEDYVPINQKYREEYAARLSTRLLILSNETSPLLDEADALTSRMLLLRTRRSFSGSENIYLEETLRAELPGILGWAMQGLAMILTGQRLRSPASTEEDFLSIQEDSNPLSEFFADCLVSDPVGWIPNDSLHDAVRRWADERQLSTIAKISPKRIATLLINAMPHVKRARKTHFNKTTRGFSGVSLKTDNL